MCVMEDQFEALAVNTQLTDTVYFGSPYRIRTVNPWVSKQRAIWYSGKGKGCTSTCDPFSEAILVQATTSTTIQSAGRRAYINSI